MRPGRLIRAARRLATALGDGSALAGGLAVAAWGEVRATRDVDFVTAKSLDETQAALRKARIPFTTRLGDPLGGDLPWVLSGELEGAAFQVFAQRGRRSFATVEVTPAGDEGAPIPVLALLDLIRLKLEAGGPKDLWDVARLIRRHPRHRRAAMELASELKVGEELSRWLERDAREG
jgi:hypothetical protein